VSASSPAADLPVGRTEPWRRRLDSLQGAAADLRIGAGRRLDALPRMGARVHPWVALVIFVATALYTQRFAVEHMASVVAGNGVEDPPQFMWAMWWWPHAILHGLNPFVTHEIWYPNAYNLASVTSTPGPALVLAPLTWAFGLNTGPIISYNVAALAAPILSAWFAYRLCLALTRAPAASILGGWLYGYSTYGFSQMEGHLNLIWTFLAPAMALLVIRYMRQQISVRRFVVFGAISLLFEMGASTEVLFTTTVLGALTLILGFIFMPERRVGLVAVLWPLAGAYLLAGILGSVFLYYALTGPSVQVEPLDYPVDLLNYIIPTRITYLGGEKFSGISGMFQGNTSEQGGYLGLPLVLMVLACWFYRWKRPLVRVMMVMTLVAAVWSMGEYLDVAGHQTFLALPFKLLVSHTPFDKMLPDRVSAFTALGGTLAAAIWLAVPGRVRIGRWLLAALAVIFIFPNANSYLGTTPLYNETFASPPFITQGLYKKYLTPNEVVLPLPFGATGSSLLWQAQAHGYFREASGWFGLYPSDYAGSSIVGQMSDFGPATAKPADMAAFLKQFKVGAVVDQSGPMSYWTELLEKLGYRPIDVGGLQVFDVRSRPTAPKRPRPKAAVHQGGQAASWTTKALR
jgi:hypothetical protein